jgi:Carboxypeptidase regulatory-like domain
MVTLRRMRYAIAGLAMALAWVTFGTRPANAQVDSSGRLTGRVLYQGQQIGVPFASVTLTPTGRARFADSSGAFVFTHVAPGSYRVRARQIGYVPSDTTVIIRPAPAVTSVTISLHRVVQLRRVVTRAKGSKDCIAPGVPDSTIDPELAQVFTEVRENVARLRILVNNYPFRYRREDEFLLRASGPDEMEEMDTVDIESAEDEGYHPGRVVVNGTGTHGQPAQFMHLVQFQDIADQAFIQTHCFNIVENAKTDSSTTTPLIRVDFRPWVKLQVPDVEGSLFIDPDRYIVKRAVFHLTRSNETSPPIKDWTYYSFFTEVVPLVPVVSGFQSYVQASRQPGTQVEDGRVLDYKFLEEAPVNSAVHDTLTGAATMRTIVGQTEVGSSPDHPCTAPISQTVVQALTGAIIGSKDAISDPGWPATARKLLTEIRARLEVPTTIQLSTFGYAAPASATDAAGRGAVRIAPGVFGRFALTFDASGVVNDVRIISTSLSDAADSAFVIAARGARSDRLGGQTVVLAVSSTQSTDTTQTLPFVHMQVPSWLQMRPVTVAPVPRTLPTSAPLARAAGGDTVFVEFVADPDGRAILSTVHRLGVPADVLAGTAMDPLTEATDDSLSTRVYLPALVGRCAVSQITTQRFVFQR